MKLAWLTDIHLNFLEAPDRLLFYQSMIDSAADAVLISGDIAEASSIVTLLSEMAEAIKKPIYFVAGNHDYYRGDVTSVHQALDALTKKQVGLCWLQYASQYQLFSALWLYPQ